MPSRRTHRNMRSLFLTALALLTPIALDAQTPQIKPPEQKPKEEPTRIEVDGRGQITLDREAVTSAQLKEKLAALKAANRDMGVVVKGADETEYQIMVGVLDTLRQLDITKMGMATD